MLRAKEIRFQVFSSGGSATFQSGRLGGVLKSVLLIVGNDFFANVDALIT